MSLPDKHGITLLFEGSTRAIPFNVIIALLLALDLLYNKAPHTLVLIWLLSIILFSIIRWLFCMFFLYKCQHEKDSTLLFYFILLTFFIGSIWGACYWLFLPYVSILQEFIIILVLGGMSAGAIASLSVYLPVYFAYVLPIFLPIIIYNYGLLNVDRTILATMFLLFISMLLISARMNNHLLNKVFRLSKEKEHLIEELEQLSITDYLTGLKNRRYFESILPTEWDKAKRNHYSLILISIDIDNFKLINDTLGHPYGDHFLIYVAKLLKQTFRRTNDIICRVGGDEFAIILLNQPLEEAYSICCYFNNQFNKNKSTNHPLLREITLSMGIVSNLSNYQINAEHLVQFADEALYQAKNDGKNRMILKKLDS